MSKYHRILCPVDLSENSFAAIEMATTLAKQYESKVVFLYVSSLWIPADAKLIPEYGEYSREVIGEEKAKLEKLRPTDSSVDFEYQYMNGNAGSVIVNATKTSDFVVMSTHGRGAVMRLLMGSVAHYVLRNSKCSVVLVKGVELEKGAPDRGKENSSFVTEVMHQVAPVHTFDEMEAVLQDLSSANESAAPVINGAGKCIGILTTSDIEKFHAMQARFEAKDTSVIEEMFEVDEYGQRRPSKFSFDKVERHMTKKVISIRDTESIQKAVELFEANPNIHHLVVLDEDTHAVGIVDALNVVGIQFGNIKAPSDPGQVSKSQR